MLKRSHFIRMMAALPAGIVMNQLRALGSLPDIQDKELMPALFMGHGSPMNAIEENEFTRGFREMGKGIPQPRAILCISAHWETKGTFVTAMDKPPTIHDFGGFPKALFDVQYPAPGSPQLADETIRVVSNTQVMRDMDWGLDHGAWSVIKYLYPQADIPVIQLSLDYRMSPAQHYALAGELALLRKKGILIIGSGNIVHNLGLVAWNKLNESYGYDWALEARSKINELIKSGNHSELLTIRSKGKAFEMAIPSLEHYLPMIYVLALKDVKDQIVFYNDKPLAGSLTMTSFRLSQP
jgi:4,5-DOPA dioxygenase extradiol